MTTVAKEPPTMPWDETADDRRVFPPVTGQEERRDMERVAEQIRVLGQRMLSDSVLRPSDDPAEHDVEMAAALALAAHLRADRIPEAMYAHHVLLSDVLRIMQDTSERVTDHYLDLISSLAEYIECAPWIFEGGEWHYRPDSVRC
jgi:hypothetical protein